MPVNIQDKIQFIESTIKEINNLKSKDLINKTLVDIKQEQLDFLSKFSTIKAEGLLSELKIKQTEVAIDNLNK
jgi:hypothetical protein